MRNVHAEFRIAHAAALREMASNGLGSAVVGRPNKRGGSTARVAPTDAADGGDSIREADEKNDALEDAAAAIEWNEAPDRLKAGRFSPPLLWLNWRSAGLEEPACWSSFHGNGVTCQGPVVGSRAPLTESEIEKYADGVNIRRATGLEEEVIETAWAYVSDNLDIVEWVLCWLVGSQDNAYNNDIVGRVNRGWPGRVDIVMSNRSAGTDEGEPAAASVRRGLPNKIKIYRKSEMWQNIVERWDAVDDVSRTCMAIDIATTIFHELLHSAGYHHANESSYCDYGDCDFAIIAQNCFRWAMHKRFPAACENSCCSCKQVPHEILKKDTTGAYYEIVDLDYTLDWGSDSCQRGFNYDDCF